MKRKKPLAALGKIKKKASAPKIKAKPVSYGMAPIVRGYNEAEYYRWREEWAVVPGCPEFVRKGETFDGCHGVAIFHQNELGHDLVSHTCFSSKAMRDQHAKALKFLYRAGKATP